ncbi:MAG: glycosyltransferase family 4 protein [Flexibacteraceae bacterium]
MKTVLITAYAVNPFKGSEDGMGWNFIAEVAKSYKVIAITRENNAPAIEKYMHENKQSHFANIQWLYFDLPKAVRFYKKGGRGAMLYFYHWQNAIVGFIQRKKLQFDLVHNLNFHNDWTPTFLWKLGKPLVWGPVGHHSPIQSQFTNWYSPTTKLMDFSRKVVKQAVRFLPGWKTAHRHTNLLLKMNTNAVQYANNQNAVIMPSVGIEVSVTLTARKHIPNTLNLISIGRLVPLKGFDLTIAAFAQVVAKYPFATLTIVGSGPEEEKLKQYAKELQVFHLITWHNWMDRSQLWNLYKAANCFLFPSHEGAGMVVAEAMKEGLPVVCLDNDGPGELVPANSELKAKIGSRETTIKHLAEKLELLITNPELFNKESEQNIEKVKTELAWNAKGEKLTDYYNTVLNSVQ